MGERNGCCDQNPVDQVTIDLADVSVSAAEDTAHHGPGPKGHQKCCDHFDPLARGFKALGHPARLMILQKLSSQNSHCCGDICSTLPLAQSTVSQHLKVLRECGFIHLETAGQQSRYKVDFDRLDQFFGANSAFFKGLHDRSLKNHAD
ncbi:DNA-binding transcriptional regulator, ArsR family [Cohaesibacter sp. ES.047]|uniref:ArsR/SmtB family transcription factor n=1 Tax=Cohaesibacter sp. ES.047 TaxID=1798205 RepID=UPI000BB7FB06|nr:metalloregulator ArsR/SmtB family transcription factor [Cohaesibacter sp. ES.047]SNY93852.1 DNA-binding transcriptional regulator, ArsR family [Cohaesibacter sp. ES.047]